MREAMLGQLRDSRAWDFVVIGGGATGLGTALDAQARGYRTLLLDASDFAKGTSSRSTKLIHGGVRYMAQGNIALVREALAERAILLRNAPHLVHERTFLVPAYSPWSLPYYGAGLGLYDALAGKARLSRSRIVGKAEALRRAPTLRKSGLWGGVCYADGQFDDARLAIALLRSFLDCGGTALNYVTVTGVMHVRGGRIDGVLARDLETGETFGVTSRVVVNAAGVFADVIRKLDDRHSQPWINASRGVHIVLDRAFLPGDAAIMVPKTDDGRVLFAIPWHNRVLIGTTDTPTNAVSLEPTATEEDIQFLLEHAGRYLETKPRREDIRSIFAGLRPLVGPDPEQARHPGTALKTSRISREHAISVSRSGLVTISGGKWTTYRRMASDTVNMAADQAALPPRPCRTATLRLRGAPREGELWSPDEPFALHGSDAPAVRELAASRPELNEPIHPRLNERMAEVAWAAQHECARTVEDVLARRTRALFLDAEAASESAPRVARILAETLNRDAAWEAAQVDSFQRLARTYLGPAPG